MTNNVLAQLHREDYSRLLAILVRRFGDIDLAEDAAQEAMEQALRLWPSQGMPTRPLAWLITTARNRAVDRIRRDTMAARRIAELHVEAIPSTDVAEAALQNEIPDERLAMLMGCCHPDIAPADRIALMLRFVGGLSTPEVAQALLTQTSTMQARITRAKKRITERRIPMSVPTDGAELRRRIPMVLTAISLIFTEGYDASTGDSPLRTELTNEAIRLARLVAHLLPDEPEPLGLLALLLLIDARRAARTDAMGIPIALEDQDRRLWDHEAVAHAERLVERAASMGRAGRFTIQAAIASLHGTAPTFDDTDWRQIVTLYDMLLALGEDPVVRMNRAIAVGRLESPHRGLALLEELGENPLLTQHPPYFVTLALFQTEVGDESAARHAWQRALELSANDRLRQFILQKMQLLIPEAER